MPYYRGDYYRGDYYRGDYYRGDNFFKKIGGAIVGGVKGFITGGPVGAITGAIGSIQSRPQQATAVVPVQAGIGGAIGTAVKVGTKVLPPLLAGKEIFDVGRGFFGGSNGRKRRTMNHLNPRALARSTRRIEGFIKKARKIASPLGYTLQRRGAAQRTRKRACK